MNCTRYQKWIKRAALDSLGASRQAKLDAHVADCAQCRGLLGTERQLAETINLALTASVSALPLPGFAERIRIRLAEESERARLRPSWIHTGWIPISAAGIVALATLLAVMWPAFRQRIQPQPSKQTVRTFAPNTSAPAASLPPPATHRAGTVVASVAAHGHMRSTTARAERAKANRSTRIEDDPPQFQVMVEPGQGRAILAAYRAAQSARVGVDELAQASDADEQPEKIKPIEVNPLVVAELYPEEPNKPAGN
ncbi:MAG TPA: hypothetical protein VMT20_10435 [Terriglobia bacterium]|nr:hypothetical protein [Terriglobia bacterium]